MSWAEDMGYDAYDFEDIYHDFQICMEITWQNLKLNGYIWQDKYGNNYKPKDISDDYLLNILNFCKRSWRPESQIKKLTQLARKRGII